VNIQPTRSSPRKRVLRCRATVFIQPKTSSTVSNQDPNGPALAIVDPNEGVVERYMPLPSEPGPLALTDDQHYLYVAMADRIRRMDLTGSAADFDIPASVFYNGNSNIKTPLGAASILPLTGQPKSFIVILSFSGFQAYVVDGATLRPRYSNFPGKCLVAIPDGVKLFSGPGLLETMLSADGLPSLANYENDALAAGTACPVYANGMIYGGDGDIVNAVGNVRVSWLPASGSVDVVPEANEIHFLDHQGTNILGPVLQFKVFDSRSRALLKSIPLGIRVSDSGTQLQRLIHWGTDGVAFGDYPTQRATVAKWLYLIRLSQN
jgi:hypothetical protein